jgi:hypothetical protein
LSGRGLCDELITRPEESYRLCCVGVCDLETSRMGASYIYDISRLRVKARYTLSVKLSDFTVWRNTWRKNWVNCAGLTGNSAGFRTVLSSRLSHTELHSSLRESHSFLSLTADTTLASSQATSVSSNSFNRWASHYIFLFKYHFLLHILRFLFFSSDNIMADVASKQQTTALFLSTTVTRTRRHTELTGKLTNLMGSLCCAREHSVQFFVQFLYS